MNSILLYLCYCQLATCCTAELNVSCMCWWIIGNINHWIIFFPQISRGSQAVDASICDMDPSLDCITIRISHMYPVSFKIWLLFLSDHVCSWSCSRFRPVKREFGLKRWKSKDGGVESLEHLNPLNEQIQSGIISMTLSDCLQLEFVLHFI